MNVDLGKTSGLEIKLDSTKNELVFGKGLNFSKAAVRTLQDMREVLLDKEIKAPQELYYMYRDVHASSDEKLLRKNKLRYDVTVIKPDMLGEELMKTAGHYHPGSFGELYEVVYGDCLCLLQRPNIKDHRLIEEVIVVKARAGDKIVIPPGFGHILINSGFKFLVTSNWVSSEFSSEYILYQKAGGAAYFVKASDSGLKFILNEYFLKNAVIKFVTPAKKIEHFGLSAGKPIYRIIAQDPQRLSFLNHPLDFDYGDVFVKAEGDLGK